MDKDLRGLKKDYKNMIPTTFTEQEKQEILQRIKEDHHPQRRLKYPFLPKPLVGVLISFALLVGVVLINDDLKLWENYLKGSGPSSTDQPLDAKDEHNEEEDTSSPNTFDVNTIQLGDMISGFKVSNINRNKEETIVTFTGTALFSGDIENVAKLMFMPDKDTRTKIPIAKSDVDKNLQVFFQDSAKVEEMFKGTYLSEGTHLIRIANQEIEVLEINYVNTNHDPELYLKIKEFTSNVKEEAATRTEDSIVYLQEPLQEIYEQFAASHDDQLLIGLEPIEVFKLYYQAKHLDDQETVYELYYNGENSGTPDKDSYFNDPYFASTDEMKANSQKFYEQLKQVKEYNQKFLDELRAVIFFRPYKDEIVDSGFQLVRASPDEPWKVVFTPMQ